MVEMPPIAESRKPTKHLAAAGVLAAFLGLGLSAALSGRQVHRPTATATRAIASCPGVVPPAPTPELAKLRQAVNDEGAAKISADPRSPNYDPVKLALLGKNPHDLHDAEPRQEAWAAAIEGQLKSLAEDRLKNVPGGSVVDVDCRTSSCTLTAEAPLDSELELQLELQAVPYGQYEAYKGQQTEDGKFRYAVVGLIDPNRKDPAAFAERLQKVQVMAEVRKDQRTARLKLLHEERDRERGMQQPQ
jgi:hypothetical protein